MRNANFQLEDWVCVNGKPMRVKAVHKTKLGFHTREDKLDWHRVNPSVEPIKLTDDILDKNLERYKWEKEEKKWVVGTCWNIGHNPNYGYILAHLDIDEFGGGYYIPCVPCTYVHELQHLIADLRIEKKIEL